MQAHLSGPSCPLCRKPGPRPFASQRKAVPHRVIANPSTSSASDEQPSTSGSGIEPRVSQYVRPAPVTYTPRSISSSGTLRPDPEWFPAWMQYRQREDNYVFWQDMFMRSSLEIPDIEKRWTVFSSLWWLVMEFKYFGTPPALRFLFYLLKRSVMQKVYEVHKALVLWQCKLDAYLASGAQQRRQASGSSSSSSSTAGGVAGSSTGGSFSRAMALRRLHLKTSPLAELLYYINICKTGRVHLLPPVSQPIPRPTFFWLF